jgi:hypothetical protein
MNESKEVSVYAVNRLLNNALLTNNRIVPVTNWYGSNGEECDPYLAVTCVCGADETGWFAVDLQNFALAKVH